MLTDPRISALYAAQTKNTPAGTSSAAKSQSDSFQTLLDCALTAPAKTVDLDAIFAQAADTYHVPLNLLKAVAQAESGFDPNAVSKAGAQGIMQLMPRTAASLGVTNSFDPEENIMGGAKYLSQMLDAFDGNTTLALAAYNAGCGNVQKYGGVPPFEETQNYVQKVLSYAGEDRQAGYAAAASTPEELDELFSHDDYELLLQWIDFQLTSSLRSLF